MMRWGQATRHAGRHLHTLYIHHGGVSTHTRKAPFSCSRKFSVEQVSSALYVPGSKATTVDGVVSPYLDFSKQFENVNLLEHSVSLRGMNVDIKEIVRKWLEWKELEKCKSDLEEKRITLTKTLNALKKNPKNKERISELKEHGKKIRNEVKAVTQKIWDLEEVAVIGALSLPSNLHDSTGSSDKLLFSVSKTPAFDFPPRSHLDLGARSEELEIMDNSPTAYYLKNRLALLELVCNDYFLTAMNDQGFLMMSNSDFVKAAVMEGSGVHFRDRSQHNTLSTGIGHDTNHLHLVGGGSLQAFSAYFTKQIIEKSDHLPFKVITAGRNYRPTGMRHPGLLGCRQSSVVDGFILYEDVGVQEKTLLHETVVMLIESYLHFNIHFQVVQYGAKTLDAHEAAAVGFLMFSPHTGQYHEVGRISLCGDYISRRLWTLCKKDKSASFASMFHIRACHIAHLLALLMENHQEQDGTYNIPECLRSGVDSL